jgi:hypothetical protein
MLDVGKVLIQERFAQAMSRICEQSRDWTITDCIAQSIDAVLRCQVIFDSLHLRTEARLRDGDPCRSMHP